MIKGLFKFAVFVVVFGIFVRYFIHSPLPQDVPERESIQIVCDFMGFVELLSTSLEFLGVSNRWMIYQNLPGFRALVSTDGFKIFEKQLAGVDCTFVQPNELENSPTPTPAVIWFFGGGFVFGDPGSNIPTLILAAKETGYLVVAPNYKKAPQNPFPTAFENCLNSTIEFIKRANEFNVDPSKIAVGGTSAGGNLAMAITMEMAKQKDLDYNPAMVFLMEPFIQMSNFRLPSIQLHQICLLSNRIVMKFFLTYAGYNHRLDLTEVVERNGHLRVKTAEKLSYISYEALPKEYQINGINSSSLPLSKQQAALLDDEVLNRFEKLVFDPRVSPLSASDKELATLPRIHIVFSEYDPLRDEAIILLERLKKLDHDVSSQILSKSVHGSTLLGAIFPEGSYYRKQAKLVFRTVKAYLEQ